LQYHFIKRPYTLVPLTLTKMPEITYLNKQGQLLANNAPDSEVAYSVYTLSLKPGIYFQPHPAFARNAKGQYYYLSLTPKQIKHYRELEDFKQLGSRELTAQDYIYEIKRLAAPGVNSPIFGLMANKIVGLQEYAQQLNLVSKKSPGFIDLRLYPLAGAQAIDRYHYKITLKGKYSQFLYWLAMPFFSPIPWEADLFYSQKGMSDNNLNFDWYPVGTGPYLLSDNNPNRKIVLEKNPLFHEEFFPSEGDAADVAAGYLKNAGQRLPFVDKAIYTLEKESIPRWSKFLQGYFDLSAISSDSYDQAIQLDSAGNPYLTPELKKMGVYLQTSVSLSQAYIGFNMLDDIVGGRSERARKLRLAISIAVDYDEYISIFLNGRGVAAQGPIPPGIFGFLQGPSGINSYVYSWQNNMLERKSISVAKQLMNEAGYPNGIDPATNDPLILNYDTATTSGPDDKSLLDWTREQFAKIGIQLNIRSTEYNRFQEKMRTGQVQIYAWAWVADYPDPENFLFLLYGPNSKATSGGENTSNYSNPQYDKLFDQMKNMQNTPERQQIINQMLDIVRRDAPWVWGVNPKNFVLSHIWAQPAKLSDIAYNTLKYQRVDPYLRNRLQIAWNRRVLWPVGVLIGFCLLISLPVFIRYWQKERKSIKKTS
jgi:oligopeptide transport system substrate-binding protein